MTARSKTRRNPWDRLEGESPAAYRAFLFYRNLGVTRNVREAEATYQQTGTKKQHHSGQWGDWSRKFHWKDRAEEWDIANLERYGEDVAINFVNALRDVSFRCLQTLKKLELKPETWEQVIDGLSFLKEFVGSESLKAIRESSRYDPQSEAESELEDD